MSETSTPAGPATVTLRYPVEIDGATIESLSIRRPIVRDLRAAQRQAGAGAPDAEVELAMFSNLCEVFPETLDAMDLADYLELQRQYERFLSRSSTSARRARS